MCLHTLKTQEQYRAETHTVPIAMKNIITNCTHRVYKYQPEFGPCSSCNNEDGAQS